MQRTIHLLLAILLLGLGMLPCLAEDNPAIPTVAPDLAKTDLWLLAGQSNMFGSASMPDKLAPPDPRVYLYNMDDRWIQAQEPLHRIFESDTEIIHELRRNDGVPPEEFMRLRKESRANPRGGIGPGLFFARHVIDKIDRNIGLIANAPGGSSMEHWSPAGRDKHGASLYGAMIDRVEKIGAKGKIRGILWYQGESETFSDESVANYEAALLNLIDSVRRDTGVPELPFLYVQICRWSKSNDPAGDLRWERTREIQRRVSSLRKNVWMVSTIDLPLTDEIHINYDAQARLGARLGEVALSKVYNVPGHATPIDFESVQVEKPHERWPVIRVKFSGVNGKLQSAGRPTGFEIRYPEAKEQTPQIFRVDFDPQAPDTAILYLGRALPAPAQLYYAPGMNPYVNIVDDKDIPVPAFGPIDLKIPPMPEATPGK